MFDVGRRIIPLICIFFLGAALQAQQTVDRVPTELISYPELIIHNAKIVTMDDRTPTGPPGTIVQAMAVTGDTIQFLGADAEVLRFVGPQTQKIDLKGHTVIPGMINTHVHLHGGYISRWLRKFPDEMAKMFEHVRRFSVSGNTPAEVTYAIELVLKEQMATAPKEQWANISVQNRGRYGFGIGALYLNEGHMTRDQLDALAPDRPVYLGGGDAAPLLNTAARNAFFDLFNLEHTNENEFKTLQNVKMAGMLMELFWRPRVAMMADGIEDGLKHYAAMGFTGFSSHIIGYPIHDAYMKLSREGRMPIRFGYANRNCQQMVVDIARCFASLGDTAGMGDKYFWNVGVTLGGLDGDAPEMCHTMDASPKVLALQECSARLDGPYWDGVYWAIRSRLRYVVNHVMGDKSIDYFLQMIEKAMKDDPSLTLDYIRSRRFSADHCGWYPRQDQLQRMAELNIHLSCASKEIDDQGAFIPKIFGEQYANRIGPINSILKSGMIVANEGNFSGTDDVENTTFARFYPFISRKRSDGVVIAPHEAINRVQLLKMSTSYPASYVLKEKELGTLEQGKLADFVVLNKDYFTVPQEEIPTVHPLMTVVGGKTIVLREELAQDAGLSAVGPQIDFTFEVPKTRDGNDWVPEEDYLSGE